MATEHQFPIPQDFRGKWKLLPQFRTKDYPEGASFEINIDEYVATIDYDLGTKAPSKWTLSWWHVPHSTTIRINTTQRQHSASLHYSPNKIIFEGPFYAEFEREGTQEESQLGWGLLFIVVFFFIAFYLSKK